MGSCRRDLLDHIIALNERHLKRLLCYLIVCAKRREELRELITVAARTPCCIAARILGARFSLHIGLTLEHGSCQKPAASSLWIQKDFSDGELKATNGPVGCWTPEFDDRPSSRLTSVPLRTREAASCENRDQPCGASDEQDSVLTPIAVI